MRVANITTRRIREILSFAAAGSTPLDALKMIVAGYARGHDLSGPGPMSWIGRKFFRKIKVKPKVLRGLSVQMSPAEFSHVVIAEEILIEQLYDLTRVPFTPDVIVDCGAHIGLFTLLASSSFPGTKLVCFEPDPSNRRWLEKQVSANHLVAQVMAAAVSVSDEEALFEPGRGFGSALAEKGSQSMDAITVKVVNLPSFIQALGSDRLLLKLDVEGAEEMLLPALVGVLPRDCVIFLETHAGQESWQRLGGLLKENGFTVTPTRQRDAYTDGVAIRTS